MCVSGGVGGGEKRKKELLLKAMWYEAVGSEAEEECEGK